MLKRMKDNQEFWKTIDVEHGNPADVSQRVADAMDAELRRRGIARFLAQPAAIGMAYLSPLDLMVSALQSRVEMVCRALSSVYTMPSWDERFTERHFRFNYGSLLAAASRLHSLLGDDLDRVCVMAQLKVDLMLDLLSGLVRLMFWVPANEIVANTMRLFSNFMSAVRDHDQPLRSVFDRIDVYVRQPSEMTADIMVWAVDDVTVEMDTVNRQLMDLMRGLNYQRPYFVKGAETLARHLAPHCDAAHVPACPDAGFLSLLERLFQVTAQQVDRLADGKSLLCDLPLSAEERKVVRRYLRRMGAVPYDVEHDRPTSSSLPVHAPGAVAADVGQAESAAEPQAAAKAPHESPGKPIDRVADRLLTPEAKAYWKKLAEEHYVEWSNADNRYVWKQTVAEYGFMVVKATEALHFYHPAREGQIQWQEFDKLFLLSGSKNKAQQAASRLRRHEKLTDLESKRERKLHIIFK